MTHNPIKIDEKLTKKAISKVNTHPEAMLAKILKKNVASIAKKPILKGI